MDPASRRPSDAVHSPPAQTRDAVESPPAPLQDAVDVPPTPIQDAVSAPLEAVNAATHDVPDPPPTPTQDPPLQDLPPTPIQDAAPTPTQDPPLTLARDLPSTAAQDAAAPPPTPIQDAAGPPPVQVRDGLARQLQRAADPPMVPLPMRREKPALPPPVQRTTLSGTPAPRRLGLGAPIVPPSADPVPPTRPARSPRAIGPPLHDAIPSTSESLPLQRTGMTEHPSPDLPAHPPAIDEMPPAPGPEIVSPTLGTDAGPSGSPSVTESRAVQESQAPPLARPDKTTTPPISPTPLPLPTAAPDPAPPVVARLLADRPLARRASPDGVVTSADTGPGRGATPPAPTGFSVQRLDTRPRHSSPSGVLPAAAPRFSAAAAVPQGFAGPLMSPALPVMRATADPAPDPGPAGSTEVDLPAAGAVTTDAPGGNSPTTASSTPPPQPAPPAAVPEELLKTLFEPLYRRLRAELRKDRDRRGLITDLRR